MARLLTAGGEAQSPQAEGLTPTGTVNIDTTNPRTGLAAYSIAALNSFLSFAFTGAISTNYYARAYVRPSANPTAVAGLIFVATGGGTLLGEADLNTDGRVSLRLNNVSIGTTVNPIPIGQYTMIELEASYPASGAATLTLRVDGVVIATGAGSSTLPGALGFGQKSASAAGATILFDDVAFNDSTGANQTSWCGIGQVVLLLPVSDAARTGWTDGAGGTTALFDAVNNVPPAGVAQANVTATSQIKDGNLNATDTYQANVGAYTDSLASGGGGLPSPVTVTLVQALANGAHAASVSGYTKAVSGISNPAATEGTGSGSATAAGVYPSNWSTVFSAVVYSPTVTLATKPVLQVRKGLSNVNPEYYDLIGLLVEYVVSGTVAESSGATGTPAGAKKSTGTVAVTAGAGATVTGRKGGTCTLAVSAGATGAVTGRKGAVSTIVCSAGLTVTVTIGSHTGSAAITVSAGAGGTVTGRKGAAVTIASSAAARAVLVTGVKACTMAISVSAAAMGTVQASKRTSGAVTATAGLDDVVVAVRGAHTTLAVSASPHGVCTGAKATAISLVTSAAATSHVTAAKATGGRAAESSGARASETGFKGAHQTFPHLLDPGGLLDPGNLLGPLEGPLTGFASVTGNVTGRKGARAIVSCSSAIRATLTTGTPIQNGAIVLHASASATVTGRKGTSGTITGTASASTHLAGGHGAAVSITSSAGARTVAAGFKTAVGSVTGTGGLHVTLHAFAAMPPAGIPEAGFIGRPNGRVAVGRSGRVRH